MVGNAYRTEAPALASTETVAQTAPLDRSVGSWPVVDEGGLRGMITAAQLEHADSDQTLADLVPAPGPAHTLAADRFPHVHPDLPLDLAMQRIARTGLTSLPVV